MKTKNHVNLEIVSNELDSGRIFLKANLDGHGIRCFWDSGCYKTQLSVNSFSKDYKKVGTGKLLGVAGIATRTDKIMIGTVSLGAIVRSNFQASRCSVQKAPKVTLGIDFFKKKSFVVDFLRNVLDTNPPLRRGKERLVIAPRGHLFINCKVGGKVVEALWDTGAGLNCVDTKYVNSNPRQFKFIRSVASGRDILGKPVAMRLLEASQVVIQTSRFKDVRFLEMDLGPVSKVLGVPIPFLLGFNTITKANWYFNLKDQSWSVFA
jgi:predicted aspartyl protease